VSVGEEASRVLLDLADVEAIGSVLAVSQQTCLERTGLAADSASNTIANINGVGEGDSRRTRSSLCGLVDVGGSGGGRAVLATEAVELDVVADQVEVGVDADLVETGCTGETASGGGAVDDLSGDSLDFVVAGEGEGGTGHLGCLGALCGGCTGTGLGVVD